MPQSAQPTKRPPFVPPHMTNVQRGTGHHVGRQLPPHKTPLKKTNTTRSPLRTKPIKPVLRAPKKKSTKRLLWWGGLSQHEQMEYIRTHPRTKLKPTRKLGQPRAAKNQGVHISPPGQHSNKHANIRSEPRRPNPKRAKTQHWRFLHQIFGHTHKTLKNPEKVNKLVEIVEGRLNKGENELLNKAKAFAQKHPELEKPPHKFRKVLTRVVIFTLMAAAGGVVAGPAGVFMATHLLNEWKNHGGDVAQLAWNGVRGKDFEGNDQEEHDQNERPVMQLIKSLKLQLDASKSKADREKIRNIIEELTDQMERYQQEKREGKPVNLQYHEATQRKSGKTSRLKRKIPRNKSRRPSIRPTQQKFG